MNTNAVQAIKAAFSARFIVFSGRVMNGAHQ
jgi:hypothetical protein